MTDMPAQTTGATAAGGSLCAAGGGVWLTVSELAASKGIGKSAMSERVARLVAAGQLETRPGKRGAKLVNLAAFDRATGQVTDPAKLAGAETRRQIAGEAVGAELPAPSSAGVTGAAPSEGSYGDARARSAQYDAELKKLDLAERQGQLMPVAAVGEAMARAAAAMVRQVDRIGARAGDMSAAVQKDGEHGARRLLKAMAFELRQAIARELRLLESEGLAAEAAGLVSYDLAQGEVAPAPGAEAVPS